MNFFIKFWIFCHFFEDLFIMLSVLKRSSLSEFLYTSNINTSLGNTELVFAHLADNHNASDSDSIPRYTSSNVISIAYKMISSSNLSTGNLFRILLNFHVLHVHNLTIRHCYKWIWRTFFVVSNPAETK